jgi:hypothetical protein
MMRFDLGLSYSFTTLSGKATSDGLVNTVLEDRMSRLDWIGYRGLQNGMKHGEPFIILG